MKCLVFWNSTLNRILNETLIVIKYITLGSFLDDLIDAVLRHLKVILRWATVGLVGFSNHSEESISSTVVIISIFLIFFTIFLIFFYWFWFLEIEKQIPGKKFEPFRPWSTCVAQPTWPFGLLRRAAARPGRNLGLGRASGSAAARPPFHPPRSWPSSRSEGPDFSRAL
jgi:ABC-type multidrug transport system permease subunit